MAVMIPDKLAPDIKSNAEKHIFEWFKEAPGTEDWIILHSLGIATHQRVIHGETDFLVLAPELGMFALEVKGGRVQRKRGKWRFINKYGEYNEKVRGPFDQAWEGIYSIRKSVEGKLDAEREYLKDVVFGIGVMFPDIDYESVGVDEEAWQVFDINDGKGVRNFITRIAKGAADSMIRLGYEVTDSMYPSAEDVEYLATLLRGDFDQDVPLRIKQKYAEEGFVSLTQEQALCVEQLEDNPRALIRGTAGTGKTLLAVEAANRAIARGERVAFFCYNKLLGEWLKDQYSGMTLEKQPMFVGTFHSYMTRLLLVHGMKINDPADYSKLNDYYKHDLPQQVVGVCSANPVVYDRIIIDEAQDLITDEYLDVLNLSLRGGLSRGRWIMFGDFSMQSIYSDSLDEAAYMDAIQKRAFFALYRLTKNCRNTKKICIDIENIVGIPENAAFEDYVDAPYVNHVTYKDADDQTEKLMAIINDLLSRSIKREDIVILSPRRRSDSVVCRLQGITIKDYSVHTVGQIRFSTLQAFKGLESSAIILTDIESYADEKLIYVGLSRARFSLSVLESQTATNERNMLFFKRRLANG